jgi:cytochrome c oxidase cbb3-type subunit I/II
MSPIRLTLASVAAVWTLTVLSLAGLISTRTAAQAPAGAAAQQQGKKVFDDNCAKCHGKSGRGDGPDAAKMGFHPRDFSLGAFKCRCTPSGQPPADEDLMRTVSKGMPGTPMVAWEKTLSESDRAAVVQYIKSFSKTFSGGNLASCPALPTPPAPSADLVAEGKGVYDKMQCEKCHGKSGRGDGPAAASLKDDWGNPIKPYNFVALKMFKCGSDDRDLFRTLQTGLTGTPMPSYASALAYDAPAGMSAEDARALADRRTWALVQYLRSLSAK